MPHVIKEVLASLVEELFRRYEQRRRGERWTPCYLAIDEWPAILSELDRKEGEEVVTLTSKLLRQGRKVDIHLITSSQDFLVETIGGSGEIRANLRTAYFAGGGLATARALLDQHITLPETPLGKGVVLLRSEEALPKPTLVRVPYASNEALYRLLPLDQDEQRYWEAFPPLPKRQAAISSDFLAAEPAQNVTFLTPRERKEKEKMAERARILELHQQGYPAYSITRMLGKAAAYTEMVKQVIAEAQAAQEGESNG